MVSLLLPAASLFGLQIFFFFVYFLFSVTASYPMNEQDISGTSIFNIIEESKDNPEPFAWSKNETKLIYNPADLLFDNTLIAMKIKGNFKNSRYILTLQGLIKYKVFYLFN